MKNLSHLIIVSILLFSSVASADLYQQYNIPVPQPGDVVCRVLVRESKPNNSQPCDHNCTEIVLPAAVPHPRDPRESVDMCRRGQSIDLSWGPLRFTRMRVASFDDVYIYQPQYANSGSNTMDPNTSTEVCNARGFDSEGRSATLRKLDSEMCFAGAEILHWDGEVSRQIRIEVVLDTYLAVPDNNQVARLLESEALSHGEGDRSVHPASYSREGAIDI